MAQDCQSCFAAFTAPASAGERFAGKLFCTRNAPAARSDNPDAWIWPLVEEDWTCREGADANTGLSYGSIVNGTPGANGAGYGGTSTTNVAIASSGSIALTTQTGLAYATGARVRATSTGSAAWMEGVVITYTAGVLTFTADLASGSGSHTDWDINLAGQPGTGVAGSGTFTCTATRPIVVANAAVQAGSKVMLTPANAEAAMCQSGTPVSTTAKGIFHVVASNVAGVSFSVDSGNLAAFAGTETFNYVIVN